MKQWLLPGLAVFGLVAWAQAAPQGLPDFTRLVEQEGRAVVNISTTAIIRAPDGLGRLDEEMSELLRRFGFGLPPGAKRPQAREHQAHSLGSGFILDSDGYVLTNAHVVSQASEINVKLADKRSFKARLIGADARSDIALLKIDARALPKVRTGDPATLRVGEWVLAIGAPFGLENSVTAGIVSAKGRNLPDETYVPFIQTDAAINPGNSGGPLFNLRGEVVGVNSQIYSRSGGYMGLSFAIPIDVALKVAEELKAHGKVQRARLGVSIQSVSEELAKGFGRTQAEGALVAAVERDGPAERAGVRAGDIILRFNGQLVQHSTDLPRMVSDAKPGSAAKVQLWREGALRELAVTLGELEVLDRASARRAFRGEAPAGDSHSRFGLVVQRLTPAQLKELGVKFALRVEEVSGAAARAGLQAGDVLLGVGSQELISLERFKQQLAALKPGEKIPLRLQRQGQPLFLLLEAPAS